TIPFEKCVAVCSEGFSDCGSLECIVLRNLLLFDDLEGVFDRPSFRYVWVIEMLGEDDKLLSRILERPVRSTEKFGGCISNSLSSPRLLGSKLVELADSLCPFLPRQVTSTNILFEFGFEGFKRTEISK